MVAPGRVQVETGLSWTRLDDGAAREDSYAIDTALRVGVGPRTELRFAFAALGIVDVRGGGGGEGIGDLSLGVRHNLLSPDGSGTALAVQAFVTLPTGTGPFDSEEWSAGLAIPASVELSPAIAFAVTPQLALLPDADGEGRHLAFGSAAGFAVGLTGTLSASADLAVTRDEDPSESATQASAGLSLAWQASADTQLDLGAAAGLNRAAPDLELYAGFVTRF